MMEPRTDRSWVPDLLLEQYRLGELSDADRVALDGRLEQDAELRRRLESLERSTEEIDLRYPPAWRAADIRRRASSGVVCPAKRRPAAGRRWQVATAVGGVAILAVAVVAVARLRSPDLPAGSHAGRVDSAAVRVKAAGPGLTLFRSAPRGSETLADGASAHAGDLIRIGYRVTDAAYGVILSVDGRGTVTLHLPRTGERAVRLTSGGEVLLDHAFELDDAPRWERFYLLTSADPFELAPVVDAARRAAEAAGPKGSPPARLDLPRQFEQASLILVKEVGR